MRHSAMPSPVGAKLDAPSCAAPPGLGIILRRSPSLKTVGYRMASLRDSGHRTACLAVLGKVRDAQMRGALHRYRSNFSGGQTFKSVVTVVLRKKRKESH